MLGRGRSNTAELRSEEVEPAEVESNVSGKSQADVWSEGSDSKPVTVEAGCGERECEDEELYIFSQCAPAPAPSATPKGSSGICSSPSIGREGLYRVRIEDARESLGPSTGRTEAGEAILPPVFGGREAARLK